MGEWRYSSTLALVELSASSPGLFITSIQRERKLDGSISDLEAVEKKKFSWLCRESNINSLVVLMVA
jgi:hypothetical protein